MSSIATKPPLPSTHLCVHLLSKYKTVFLALLRSVTGLAVLYEPVASTISPVEIALTRKKFIIS